MDTVNFNVPSISCSMCSGKIQQGLKELDGINKTEIDLKSQIVNVEYNPDVIKPMDIKKTIASMGYEVN